MAHHEHGLPEDPVLCRNAVRDRLTRRNLRRLLGHLPHRNGLLMAGPETHSRDIRLGLSRSWEHLPCSIEVSRYPGAANIAFADALVFDNRTRLHATWHSGECCPNGTFATSVYVGRSDNLGQTFDNASFRVTFQGGAGGNATSFEHLVAGLDDKIGRAHV